MDNHNDEDDNRDHAQNGDGYTEQQKHALLVSMWAIQNSALQSFRALFVASETFILSAAAILTISPDGAGFVLGLTALGSILILPWRLTCTARGYDDSYLRWQILRLERGDHVSDDLFTCFREWQTRKNKEKSDKLDDELLGKAVRTSCARTIMDVVQPYTYFVCWAVVAGSVIVPRVLSCLGLL